MSSLIQVKDKAVSVKNPTASVSTSVSGECRLGKSDLSILGWNRLRFRFLSILTRISGVLKLSLEFFLDASSNLYKRVCS